MKHIFITIILFSVSAISQEEIVPIENQKDFDNDGNAVYYYKDVNNELDKFLGTWRYENGNTSFEITFVKNEYVYGSSDYYDELLATSFKYINNGAVIFDSINYDPSNTNERFFQGGFFTYPDNLNIIEFLYIEPEVSPIIKIGNLKLIHNNSGGNETLIWSVGFTSNNDGANPFKMPMLMTLIKQ